MSKDVFIMIGWLSWRATFCVCVYFVVVSVYLWESTMFDTSGGQRVHPVLDGTGLSYQKQ